MLQHLYALLIVLAVGIPLVTTTSPKTWAQFIAKVKDVNQDIALWLRDNGFTRLYDDDAMKASLNVYSKLLHRIKFCHTEDELSRWYDRIQRFHDNYSGIVSDEFINVLTDNLYTACKDRKSIITGRIHFHLSPSNIRWS